MTEEEFRLMVRGEMPMTEECKAELERISHRLDTITQEEVAEAMESLPTEALEWAVRFEALSHIEREQK